MFRLWRRVVGCTGEARIACEDALCVVPLDKPPSAATFPWQPWRQPAMIPVVSLPAVAA